MRIQSCLEVAQAREDGRVVEVCEYCSFEDGGVGMCGEILCMVGEEDVDGVG